MILKQAVKNITKEFFFSSGLADLMLHNNRGRLCIVCYHRISGPEQGLRYLAIPQDLFERHILFLKKHFTIVPFDAAMERYRARAIKEPLLVLTFDDGYSDNYLYAFPVLKKYGLAATIFLTVDYIGTEKRLWWNRLADIVMNPSGRNAGFHQKVEIIETLARSLKRMNTKDRDRRIQGLKEGYGVRENAMTAEREFLNWEEIKEMSKCGIDFGSHTLTHPNLTLLNKDELKREVLDSRKILEKILGREIRSFAYPYGSYNDRIKEMVKESNYSYARSGSEGFNAAGVDEFALKRIDALIYSVSHLASRLSYRGILG